MAFLSLSKEGEAERFAREIKEATVSNFGHFMRFVEVMAMYVYISIIIESSHHFFSWSTMLSNSLEGVAELLEADPIIIEGIKFSYF